MFCALTRWMISRSLDAGTPPSRRMLRHVSRCPACRRFLAKSEALAARLAADADAAAVPVSPSLHGRILRRCRTASDAAPADRKLPLGVRPAVLFVGAAAVLLGAAAALILWPSTSETPTPSPRVARAPAGGGRPVVWLVGPREIAAEPAAIVEDVVGDPVADELNLLRDDIEAAAGFLLACVPLDLGLDDEAQTP